MPRFRSAPMRTAGVRVEEPPGRPDPMSPAALKSLAQEAALVAMARTGGAGAADVSPAVTHEDFEQALARLREGALAETASFSR